MSTSWHWQNESTTRKRTKFRGRYKNIRLKCSSERYQYCIQCSNDAQLAENALEDLKNSDEKTNSLVMTSVRSMKNSTGHLWLLENQHLAITHYRQLFAAVEMLTLQNTTTEDEWNLHFRKYSRTLEYRIRANKRPAAYKKIRVLWWDFTK